MTQWFANPTHRQRRLNAAFKEAAKKTGVSRVDAFTFLLALHSAVASRHRMRGVADGLLAVVDARARMLSEE